MSRAWVVNASPLIVLSAIHRADLLLRLSDVIVIPAAVAREIEQGPDASPARLWLRSNLNLISPTEPLVNPTVAAWDLGSGETAVLTFAMLDLRFEAIVDDRAARSCGAALGVRVRGTLGVLLLAKRASLIPSVKPEIESLAQVGFRVGGRVRDAILHSAGEI